MLQVSCSCDRQAMMYDDKTKAAKPPPPLQGGVGDGGGWACARQPFRRFRSLASKLGPAMGTGSGVQEWQRHLKEFGYHEHGCKYPCTHLIHVILARLSG